MKTLLMIAAVLGLVVGAAVLAPAEEPTGNTFADRVDLTPLGTVAVHTEGRLKSFSSYASEKVSFVSGPRAINGQTPEFSYFDMMFREGHYKTEDVIFVKNKNVRARLIDVLKNDDEASASFGFTAHMEAFLESGLISEDMLRHEKASGELARMSEDLIRTARDVGMIEGAITWKTPRVLAGNLALLPPVDHVVGGTIEKATAQTPWVYLTDVIDTKVVGPKRGGFPASADAQIATLQGAWTDLEEGWAAQDADRVNSAVATMAEVLPTVNPELYPPIERLKAESWYFGQGNMTWVWMVYFLSAMVLLMGIVYRWEGTRRAGMWLFGISFLLHCVSIGLRWWVAGRWPNTNMYEAVTTAAWFGGFGALYLEFASRKTKMRGMFAFTSAVGSMVALMAAEFLPTSLNASIGNMMPVLDDIWLKIHTNVIIWSYALIFAAAISALLYVGWRIKLWVTGAVRGVDYARNGGAGALMMATAVGAGTATGSDPDMAMAVGGTEGDAVPAGGGAAVAQASTLGQTLDGVTMLLMEVSFVMLWAGIAMGAIWADHSWGRPWGWDPKEVYALNTFLVFAVLVHVRIKTKDKGLWTALLAIVGAAVMMFNWVVINFVIAGLHSYA